MQVVEDYTAYDKKIKVLKKDNEYIVVEYHESDLNTWTIHSTIMRTNRTSKRDSLIISNVLDLQLAVNESDNNLEIHYVNITDNAVFHLKILPNI